MYCFRKFKRTGSLTVEISLLMPGILAIIIFVIYLGFYLHDKCVIERSAYSALNKCVYDCAMYNTLANKNAIIQTTENQFDACVYGRTVGKWYFLKNVNVDNDGISIRVKGYMKTPGGLVAEFLKNNVFTVEIQESVMRKYEPDEIRK